MIKIVHYAIFFLLVTLALINVHIFVSGMRLGDEINYFESEVVKFRQENSELEKHVYEIDSLQHAASLSAALDFTKKVQPYYIDNFTYATIQKF